MTAPDSNTQAGQRFQEKLEFYLVALAFTILGLAAQTAEFGTLVWADLTELIAWAALLLSGLKGLYRLERIPHIYDLFSRQAEQEGYLTHIRRNPTSQQITFLDETLLHSEALVRVEGNVTQIKAAIEPRQEELVDMSRTQRRALALGVTMLVIARGIPPILDIFRQVTA